ncbi:formate dehydrogenase accessory sulfurtransferase FdhD [Rubritalea tangerina]|uniref:Sulfur carrier protein FdhD n=1 Tax=Rubritalea tangerina TaxID=430798 RepID=A0ABW4Z867_9BACT
MASRASQKEVWRYAEGSFSKCVDSLSGEEPIQITIDGHPIAVVMRTAGDDEELVTGFLLSEGVIQSVDEITRVDLEKLENNALVFLEDEVDYAHFQRHLYSASSCGICGKASIEAIDRSYPEIARDGVMVSPDVLLGLPDKLRDAQAVFERTGGLHAAALFDEAGGLLVIREDVGRHNAIDKVIGWAALSGVDLSKCVLQLSGRVSFEVMQKARSAGIAIVSAISAPTDLAVEFACESGQTLIGFLRPPQFNCYSGEWRVRREA